MLLKPENITTEVTIPIEIDKANKPYPIVANGIYECKSCTHQYEIPQISKKLRHPKVCAECGNKTFTLILSECTFTEIQELEVHEINTERTATLFLRGKNCDDYCYQKNSQWTVYAKLGLNTAGNTYCLYDVTRIDKRRK